MIFLKLGGSLLTDKTTPEAVRVDVLRRLAGEIAAAREAAPGMRLLLGHGSGSFGHVAAARHGTRAGAGTADAWRGMAEVADAAARLNRRVVAALLAAGLPALSLAPSASAACRDGQLADLSAGPVGAALNAGMVPVVYGDVAFDADRGATIVSTEEVLAYLAPALLPGRVLLAGEVAGVLGAAGAVIPHITPENLSTIADALGASRGTDVTGGMDTKVRAMLNLAAATPGLHVRVFSGLVPGLLREVLLDRARPGTLITA